VVTRGKCGHQVRQVVSSKCPAMVFSHTQRTYLTANISANEHFNNVFCKCRYIKFELRQKYRNVELYKS